MPGRWMWPGSQNFDRPRHESTSLPLVRAGKGGRAVECTGLENRQAGNPRLGSSNLPPSVASQTLRWDLAWTGEYRDLTRLSKCSVLEPPGG